MLRDLLPASLRDKVDIARSDRRTIDGVPVWVLNERADIETAQLIARFTEMTQPPCVDDRSMQCMDVDTALAHEPYPH